MKQPCRVRNPFCSAMIRVCAACQQKARCSHDLDAATAAQHYEEYCPNAPSIDELGERP